MAENTNFLTRLAGRTLGLIPTIQPVIAPMYAPGQQLGYSQGLSPDEQVFTEDVPVTSDEAVFRSRDRQIGHPQGISQQPVHQFTEPMPPPLVPKGNQTFVERIEVGAPHLSPQNVSPGLHPGEAVDGSSAQEGVPTVSDVELLARRVDTARSEERPQEIAPISLPGIFQNEENSFARIQGRRQAHAPTNHAALVGAELASALATIALENPALGNSDPTPGNSALGNTPFQNVSGREIAPTGRSERQTTGRPQVSLPPTTPLPPPRGREPGASLTIEQREVVSESPSATPTIQVTIGRIEVRAMPPQKTSPKDAATPSGPHVMSLEEYLNQRAKGGR